MLGSIVNRAEDCLFGGVVVDAPTLTKNLCQMKDLPRGATFTTPL
jgi:hypothetical protein